MFRSKIHSRTLGAAIALATVTTLAACSTSTGTAEQAGKLSTDPGKVSGSITFSTWWAYADQALIDGFKAKYPNVKVKLDFSAIDSYPAKIQTLASSGGLPDVFAAQSATLTALSGAKQLYDLTPALATESADQSNKWGDTFNASLLKGANSDMLKAETSGQTYGVPFDAISVASIYNKDAFAKAGVTPATSFDQLLSNCRALKSAGYIPMSLTGSVWGTWWTSLAWDQTMQTSKIADFKVSNPDYVKGFEIVKKMADAGCWDSSQVTTDIAAETSLFLQGKTAQFVSVPENFLASVAKGASFKLGTYVLPPLDGKTPNRILGGGNANVLVVNKNTKNASAAVAFVKYLTSKKVQTSLAASQYIIPSINVDLSSGNPLMDAYLKAAGNGFTDSSTYLPAFTPAGQTKFASDVLPRLILGKLSPSDAATATAELFVK